MVADLDHLPTRHRENFSPNRRRMARRFAVAFAGLTPGLTGLYQVNATVPSGVAAGNQVPVVLAVDGAPDPPVTTAVK